MAKLDTLRTLPADPVRSAPLHPAPMLCVVVPVVIAVVVGLTRVLLAAHWLTDVVAAWLLGAAWLALVITAHRLYLTARRRGAQLVSGRDHRLLPGLRCAGPAA